MVGFNVKVVVLEKEWGFWNSVLINLMKFFGNIENDVEEVFDFYFYKCFIEMSCVILVWIFFLFVNYG